MSENSQNTSFIKVLIWTIIGGAVSAVINVIIFNFAHSQGFIPDSILLPGMTEPLSTAPVALSSLVPSIAAGIVFSVLRKYFKRAFLVFTGLSIILLVVLLIVPFSIPGMPREMFISLSSMHVVVVACILAAIKKAI